MSNAAEPSKDLEANVLSLNEQLPEMCQGVVFGGSAQAPRFELYHAGFSLCSNKVRCVLAEKEAPYISHALRIGPVAGGLQENYLPDYVRLRLKGAPGGAFATGYRGVSSVETEGFDPAVVPTLVDHEKARVLVDSLNICKYLDREVGEGPTLVPEGLEDVIDAQIALIDQAPHVALLYGAHPDADTRPEKLISNITGVHAKKIAGLQSVLDQLEDGSELIPAYRAKIEKERAAATFIQNGQNMREVHAAFADHVGALEAQLGTHDGPWVLGDAYTLADIMWTVSLYRLALLGLQRLWAEESGSPRVAAYMQHAPDRPSFQEAVVGWRAGAKPRDG
ncbi:MAG: glutathione S-transferase family protein [Pseudomonadota bacterium]